MMQLADGLDEKNAIQIQHRQYLIYQRRARDVKFGHFCALSLRTREWGT